MEEAGSVLPSANGSVFESVLGSVLEHISRKYLGAYSQAGRECIMVCNWKCT